MGISPIGMNFLFSMQFLHDGFISGHIAKLIQQGKPCHGEGRFHLAKIEVEVFRAVFKAFVLVDEFLEALFKVCGLRVIEVLPLQERRVASCAG